jgi:hypothetical protein
MNIVLNKDLIGVTMNTIIFWDVTPYSLGKKVLAPSSVKLEAAW